MIRLLADENFNGRILRGVLRIRTDADIVRVQVTPMLHVPDPKLLDWAAQQNRIVISHDTDTMTGFANERITQKLLMPGLIIARDSLPIGLVVDNLLMILGASDMHDWENAVTFLPL